MNDSKLTITGYSTALFSTWFFIEELGILFDAGEGLTSSLLQKSRKIKNVFISHADRDHLTGLFQFNQLNARAGFPIIHYPADCGSFPAIAKFVENFDPHAKGTLWKPIAHKDVIKINKNISVRAMKNNHVPAEVGTHKSLSFKILDSKKKLKPEFLKLSNQDLKRVIDAKGRDFISNDVSTIILGYSGDTPVDDYSKWEDTKILIHEATFLDNKEGLNTHANKHSNLEEVIKMVSNINIEMLILSHFSSRYSKEEIDKSIRKLCKLFKIKIPIYRVLPGIVSRNILSDPPINA